MNYVVIFKHNSAISSVFFTGRDESSVVFKEETLIRNEDDIINIMLDFFDPDNGDMVIHETLLDSKAFSEERDHFLELQRYL